MSTKKFSVVVLCLLFVVAILIGCGSASKEGTSLTATKVSDGTCAANSCHGGQYSRVISDSQIIPMYQQSQHAKTAIYEGGVGCQDCHGGGSLHFGEGPLPYPNPSADGRCFECHEKYLPAAHYNTLAPAADAVSPAMYLATNTKDCNKCHNPHDPDPTSLHTEYAESGHGDVNGVAWATEDFKENKSCIRCHTTTGFIEYTTHFQLPTETFADASDHTREVLACNACHSSYDFKNSVREFDAITAPYNIDSATNTAKNPTTFPDVGSSNICIACHAGRESGKTVVSLTSFTNTSFKNSHYLPAAGMMYVKSGFVDFVASTATITVYDRNGVASSSTYGATLTSTEDGGSISSTHRKFGTSEIVGYSTYGITADMTQFTTGGPCVVCHMSKSADADAVRHHSLEIDAYAFNNICVTCHDDEVVSDGTSTTLVVLTADNFKTAFIEEQASFFQDALSVAKAQLAKYDITYDAHSYPYFFDDTLGPDEDGNPQQVKDWTRGGTVNGMKLMGACFNINLLTKESAAYAHARTYTRRLIYDTIDFLDDETINRSTVATAKAFDGTKYFEGPTALDPATTESLKFLKAYKRSDGTWYAVDRP